MPVISTVLIVNLMRHTTACKHLPELPKALAAQNLVTAVVLTQLSLPLKTQCSPKPCVIITLMAKRPTKEPDSVYFLKLVLYVMAGSFWLRLSAPLQIGNFDINALPIGFVVGLILASHEHFQLDRKIEYAVLLIATIASFFLPTGILL